MTSTDALVQLEDEQRAAEQQRLAALERAEAARLAAEATERKLMEEVRDDWLWCSFGEAFVDFSCISDVLLQAEKRQREEAERAAAEERARAEREEEARKRLEAMMGSAPAKTGDSAGSARSTLAFDTLKRRSVSEMLSGQAFLELLQDQEVDDDEKAALREKARAQKGATRQTLTVLFLMYSQHGRGPLVLTNNAGKAAAAGGGQAPQPSPFGPRQAAGVCTSLCTICPGLPPMYTQHM